MFFMETNCTCKNQLRCTKILPSVETIGNLLKKLDPYRAHEESPPAASGPESRAHRLINSTMWSEQKQCSGWWYGCTLSTSSHPKITAGYFMNVMRCNHTATQPLDYTRVWCRELLHRTISWQNISKQKLLTLNRNFPH